MQNAPKFIVSGLIIAVAGTTYALNAKTPEQIISESIRQSNIQINIRNTAKVEEYKQSLAVCQSTASGSNTEVLQQLSACLDRPKPILEKEIATLGDNNSGKILGEMRCPELYMSGSEVFSPRYGVTWEFTIKEAKELYPKCKILDNAKATIATNTKDLRLSICKNIPNSPLCNEENYTMARAIAYKKALIWGIADREYFFRVGIGIMNSESTLGTKYAGTCDQSYNNFGGIKYRILDTGKAVHDQTIPQNGCWMYKFATMEDYFGSKYNSLGKGYGKCFAKKDAVQCIAFAYVGDPKVAEQSWQNNVNTYAK